MIPEEKPCPGPTASLPVPNVAITRINVSKCRMMSQNGAQWCKMVQKCLKMSHDGAATYR